MDTLFLERLLVLLARGSFTTTYKYALLLALIDLNLEGAGRGAEVTTITTRQLAERVVALYWPHTRPFQGRELSQSRAGQQMAQANEDLSRVEDELVAMEAKYNDLLAEGDTQTAAQLMTQIRRKNAELNSITAAQRDAEVMARAVEKVRFDEALDRIEAAYPELDPDSDEYDEDTYQDVYDLMMAGRQRGLSATKALQRAVARVMGAETTAQKRATTATPRVNENDVASRRRGEAVRRNLDAARRTPPATHRISANNDAAGGALTAKAVMSMSEDDFEKLSDKDLARLRGDVL